MALPARSLKRVKSDNVFDESGQVDEKFFRLMSQHNDVHQFAPRESALQCF